MIFYLRSSKKGIDAKGSYDKSSGLFIVKKGSIVSEVVSHSEKFRGAKTVEKLREEYVSGNKVKKDVEFKSSSSAANFVTGCSTNGFVAWKDESGKTFKECISE